MAPRKTLFLIAGEKKSRQGPAGGQETGEGEKACEEEKGEDRQDQEVIKSAIVQ